MPRQRKVDPEHLQTLEQRLARAQRELRLALAAQRDQARRDDARRKIIAGALALEHFEKNSDSEFGRTLFRLLDEYVVRPHDRALFPFLPEPEPLDPESGSADPGAEFSRPRQQLFRQKKIQRRRSWCPCR